MWFLNSDIARENASIQFLADKELIDLWIDLNTKFNASFRQKAKLFIQIPENLIKSDFQKSLEVALSFSPEKISVGVSDDECAYIYFEKDDKAVYFDLFFEPQQTTEAAVTVFQNKESILSFTDCLDNSIYKLNKYFFVENELSSTTFAKI